MHKQVKRAYHSQPSNALPYIPCRTAPSRTKTHLPSQHTAGLLAQNAYMRCDAIMCKPVLDLYRAWRQKTPAGRWRKRQKARLNQQPPLTLSPSARVRAGSAAATWPSARSKPAFCRHLPLFCANCRGLRAARPFHALPRILFRFGRRATQFTVVVTHCTDLHFKMVPLTPYPLRTLDNADCSWFLCGTAYCAQKQKHNARLFTALLCTAALAANSLHSRCGAVASHFPTIHVLRCCTLPFVLAVTLANTLPLWVCPLERRRFRPELYRSGSVVQLRAPFSLFMTLTLRFSFCEQTDIWT